MRALADSCLKHEAYLMPIFLTSTFIEISSLILLKQLITIINCINTSLYCTQKNEQPL